MKSLNKLDTAGRSLPVVYVLWVSSPNAAAGMDVRGVYADVADAGNACSVLINQGKQAHISGATISTPGVIGEDGTVWLHRPPGSASFTAFGDMNQADARRQRFGGDVRAYQVIGLAGNAGKVAYGGDLRKKVPVAIDPYKKGYDGSSYGLTPAIVKELATRAPVELRKLAFETVKLAQTRPYDYYVRRNA
jgi:hypothetical protein